MDDLLESARKWAPLVNTILIPLVGMVILRAQNILKELRLLNGRVGRLEQWTADHEKRDTERFHFLGVEHHDR